MLKKRVGGIHSLPLHALLPFQWTGWHTYVSMYVCICHGELLSALVSAGAAVFLFTAGEEKKEGEFPSHEDVGSGKGEVLDTPSLLSPDDKQGGCEVVEVEMGQGGSAGVDRLMSEIQEMHLVVQSLLKGSRVEEGEEEEEEGEEEEGEEEEGRGEDKQEV